MTYFGYPFDHFLMNFEDPYYVCHASIEPTYMNFAPYVYHGSLVLVTLALSFDAELMSAVPMRNVWVYGMKI